MIPIINQLQDKDFQSALDSIKNTYDSLQSRIAALRQENQYLHSEQYKDNELKDMQAYIDKVKDDYSRGFPISKEESDAINKWELEHTAKMHNAKTLEQRLRLGGAIGGNFTYHFIPTSIGTVGTCRCSSCYNKAMKEFYNSRTHVSHTAAELDLKKTLIEKWDAEFEFQNDL